MSQAIWSKIWRNNIFQRPTGRRHFSRSRRRLTIDPLESRRLLAATAGFASGTLSIDGDSGDNDLTLSVESVLAYQYVIIKEAGTIIFDGRPDAENVRTFDISTIDVDLGAGNDKLDLTTTQGLGVTNKTGFRFDLTTIIDGGTGNDTITGTAFSDSITGGDGNDVIDGNYGDDTIIGGDGADSLTGGGGADRLEGGTGNDALIGGTGNDVYVFDRTTDDNLGEDTLTELLDDTMAGTTNDSRDVLDLSDFGLAINSLDLSTTSQQPIDTTLVGSSKLDITLNDASAFEDVIGSGLADSITGNSRDNILEGGAGNDTLAGGTGDDTYVFARQLTTDDLGDDNVSGRRRLRRH